MDSLFKNDALLLVIALLWYLPWKGVALWKAGSQRQKWWFIVLFLVNTLGVLDILYIFVFSKKATGAAHAHHDGHDHSHA